MKAIIIIIIHFLSETFCLDKLLSLFAALPGTASQNVLVQKKAKDIAPRILHIPSTYICLCD